MKCKCGESHNKAQYNKERKPLDVIIEASKKAADADDYASGLSEWVATLRSVASHFGVKDSDKHPMRKLSEALESKMRKEAAFQSDANRPKVRSEGDKEAGMFHGGLRGIVQEAQHHISRARKNLEELRKWEAKEAKRRASKTAAK